MTYDPNYLSGPMKFGGKGVPQMHVLDTVDLVSTAIGSGYVSDAYLRGWQIGDFVLIRKFNSLVTRANPSISLHTVTAGSATAAYTLSAAYGSASGLTVPVVSSTATPTVNEDTADGFMLGSLWVETDQEQVYAAVGVTAGAAVWRPIIDQYVLGTDHFSIDTDGTTATLRLLVQQPGRLIKAGVVNEGVTTSAGSAILTLSRNATAITNGVITVAGTSGTGATAVCTPTAANVFAINDVLTGVLTGTQTASATVNFVALFERNAS